LLACQGPRVAVLYLLQLVQAECCYLTHVTLLTTAGSRV
jgi:hypothetical protein